MNVVKVIEISNMLTIKNFERKLLSKSPSKGDWWVSAIEETETQYHIWIMDKDGNELNRINIERTPLNYEYELWWWHNDPDPAHQVPIRHMLSVYDLKMGYGPLLELIDYKLKKN
jgi:hypothetical protein